jgi:hypothetical protein
MSNYITWERFLTEKVARKDVKMLAIIDFLLFVYKL